MITRRQFMRSSIGASLTLSLPRLSVASNHDTRDRFVLVILRGGLDGLAAMPAYGDPNYRSTRGALALPEPGEKGGIINLDGFFGLHPSLVNLGAWFESGELIAVHGAAPPYHKRSHFDAQNVLETGVFPAHSLNDGWLYRALRNVAHNEEPERVAISVGPSVPTVLRGEHPVDSWAPDNLPDPDEDTLSRIVSLYQRDEILGPKLMSAMATADMAGSMNNQRAGRGDALPQLASAAARFLAGDKGPQIAVLEASGWDSHVNQGAETGQLANRLGQLDEVLGQLRNGLGPRWKQTAVLVVTEFGRTVAINGNRGTDHGVGGAAFLFGGAVKGGRVLADWQGLAKNELFEGRDVHPTIDHRQLFKSVLVDHMGCDGSFVEDAVFPSSAAATRIKDLFRS